MKTIPTFVLFLFFQFTFAQSLVLDDTFDIAVSQNSDFRDFVILPDGKLLVCGYMMSGNRMLRFNANGSIDSTFTGSSANSSIIKIVVDPQGRIYVMGTFTQYNGFNRNYLVRLNSSGSLDTTFNPSLSERLTNEVSDVNFLSDGRIVVVGDFSCAVPPQNPNGFVILSDTGVLDNSVTDPYIFSSVPGGVDKVFIDTHNNMYVYSFAGGFKKFTSNLVPVELAYNSLQSESVIKCGFFKNDSELVIGGMIGNESLPSRFSYLANININDFSFTDGFVNAAVPYNSQGSYSSRSTIFESLFEHQGYIYGAGNVPEYESTTAYNIVRLNQQGYLDTSFDVSRVFQFYDSANSIRKFEPYNSEYFIVSGNFSSVNGTPTKRLVRVKLNNLSTEKISKFDIKFVNNILYANDNIKSIELFDVCGRKVFSNNAVYDNNIDLNLTPKGVYVINLVFENSRLVNSKRILIR